MLVSTPKWLNRINVDPDETREEETSPEQNLWTAVIERALRDLNPSYSDSSCSSKWRISAYGWIVSMDTEPGSFLWACKFLDLDPMQLKKLLDQPMTTTIRRRRTYF